MAAATTYPYDDATPTTPSIEALGGSDKIDDAKAPPGQDEPEAGAWNNLVRIAAASCRMLPLATVEISFAAGAPYVSGVTSMRTSIAAADFSLTDNGVGDTTIEWAATLLPPMTKAPKVYVNGTTVGASCASAPTALSVQVVTEHSGAAADLPFTVDIR